MYTKTSHNIKVTVMPSYLEGQSNPDTGEYIWAYTIQVENHGEETVQLINRYWHITDAQGEVQEVRGEGVIGEKPTLEPNQAFRYTSGVPLSTPSGVMKGHYEMENEFGERFLIEIPIFSLDSPTQIERPN